MLHISVAAAKATTGDYMKTEKLALYKFLQKIVVPLFLLIFRPTVQGAENIPVSGGVILAGNHKSNLDCILVACGTRRCVHFMAKDELFRGVFAPFFRALGAIPVNRRVKDAASLSAAESVIRENGVIGVFPEGRFNRSKATLLPFKHGAVRMAVRCGVPIVPFAIVGSYSLFGRRVRIKIFKPIASDNAPMLSKTLESIVRTELEQ